MTAKDLKQLHALNKEIEYERKTLLLLKSKGECIGISGIGALQKEQYKREIESLEARIEAHLRECLALYNEILDFINSVDDSLLRLVLSLRYINALEWEQIALHIGGTNTGDGVRKLCERFMKRTFG